MCFWDYESVDSLFSRQPSPSWWNPLPLLQQFTCGPNLGNTWTRTVFHAVQYVYTFLQRSLSFWISNWTFSLCMAQQQLLMLQAFDIGDTTSLSSPHIMADHGSMLRRVASTVQFQRMAVLHTIAVSVCGWLVLTLVEQLVFWSLLHVLGFSARSLGHFNQFHSCQVFIVRLTHATAAHLCYSYY